MCKVNLICSVVLVNNFQVLPWFLNIILSLFVQVDAANQEFMVSPTTDLMNYGLFKCINSIHGQYDELIKFAAWNCNTLEMCRCHSCASLRVDQVTGQRKNRFDGLLRNIFHSYIPLFRLIGSNWILRLIPYNQLALTKVALLWDDPYQDQWSKITRPNHGKSSEPMDPFPEWIRWFL